MINTNTFRKNRTVCKGCYNKNKREINSNNTLTENQQTKFDNNNNDNNPSVSAYESHRHVIIGPNNVG